MNSCGNPGDEKMTAYNVVRFRTKPGQEQAFIDAHKKIDVPMKGFRRLSLVKTGDQTFCVIGEWDKFDSIVAARPSMIGMLDSFRNMLEDLGSGLGVTDPVSGDVAVEIAPRKKKKKASAARKKPRARKRRRK
jgi:Antibiotic biosynthesis monooxygenase